MDAEIVESENVQIPPMSECWIVRYFFNGKWHISPMWHDKKQRAVNHAAHNTQWSAYRIIRIPGDTPAPEDKP